MASAQRLAALTFRPFQHVAFDVAGWALYLASSVLVLAVQDVVMVAFVGLGVLVALLTVAGLRLQRELDRRDEPRFHVKPLLHHEITRTPIHLGDDPRAWLVDVTLFVIVVNEGPAARFAARIDDVEPAVDESGVDRQPYSVDEVAWENTVERFNEIPGGSSARLKTVSAAEWRAGNLSGRAWWFHTAQSASYAPGQHAAGRRLEAPQRGAVVLKLTAANLESNQRVCERFRIEFYSGVPRAFERAP